MGVNKIHPTHTESLLCKEDNVPPEPLFFVCFESGQLYPGCWQPFVCNIYSPFEVSLEYYHFFVHNTLDCVSEILLQVFFIL